MPFSLDGVSDGSWYRYSRENRIQDILKQLNGFVTDEAKNWLRERLVPKLIVAHKDGYAPPSCVKTELR